MSYDWKVEDLKSMKNPSPEDWPCYPLLPMKNYELVPRGSMPLHGVILAGDEKPTIYIAYLADLGVQQHLAPMGGGAFELTAEMNPVAIPALKAELACCQKKYEYESFEAMQAAGWCVD